MATNETPEQAPESGPTPEQLAQFEIAFEYFNNPEFADQLRQYSWDATYAWSE